MSKQYDDLLFVMNHCYEKYPIIIEWSNGLKVKCNSFTGEYETDTEPGDDDYIGEYAAAVDDVVILEKGSDDSVEIYNDCIEISLICIPEKIFKEDGTLLWQRPPELKSI